MSDIDKMRDDAIREAARNAAVDEYFKARPQLMRTRHEECLVEAGFNRGWQAAQSVQSKSVPVVGEPVGFILIYEDGGKSLTFHDNTGELSDGWSQHKLVIQPAHSITEAELERLRKMES